MGSPTDTVLPALRAAAVNRSAAPALLWLQPHEGCSEGQVTTAGASKWRTDAWSFAEAWALVTGAAATLRELCGDVRRREALTEAPRIGVAIAEGPALPLVELAVLEAGCAIVPFDSRDPCARLASAVGDAEPLLIVAADAEGCAALEEATAAAFSGAHTGRRPRVVLAASLLDLAAPRDTLAEAARRRGAMSDVEVGTPPPDATSHIFFTSGSTGRPKGCISTHRALANYCAARNAAYDVGEETVCFVASAHTFDPSLGDLVATWAAGGCLVYAPRAALLPHLGALLAASATTHLCCTPTVFATLLGTRHSHEGSLPALRVVALGGEPTPLAIAETWADRRPRFRLFNTYGVTECCVYNSAHLIRKGEPLAFIGAALLGNVLAVVGTSADAEGERGERFEESGHEEEGELLIAGAQVGRGYLRRPDLTSERFVQHPRFGPAYLTGDLAREDALGNISVLGRRDSQVKVRGQRVELAEVDHWLLKAAGALLSAVAATCISGRLYAFCVPSDGISSLKARSVLCALLRWLADRGAPSQMRPERYVFVGAIPLTASGKTARGQLAELLAAADQEAGQPDDDVGGGASGQPLQGMEADVANAWALELGQPVSGIRQHDDFFFDLGGHSIVALRVCRRLALKLGAGGAGSDQDHDAMLGGDLGELVGPFAPAEMLRRPRLADYAAYLSTELRVSSSTEPPPQQCRADDEQLRNGGTREGAVDAPEDTCPEAVLEATERLCAPGQADGAGRGGVDLVELLHRSAAAGAVPLIDFLVAGGHAPVDGRCSTKRLKAETRAQRALRQVGKNGDRPPAPLRSAVGGASLGAVAALLRLRASVSATDAHGAMAVHLAASRGSAEMVGMLLEAKAPLAAKDLNMQTVLHYAARSGNVAALEPLIHRWLDDPTLVSQSSRVYGGALDWRDRWHRTPVHWSTLNGHVGALAALLEAKASPAPPRVPTSKHAKNTTLRHETPLEIALRTRHSAVVELLLHHGAGGAADAAAAEPLSRCGVTGAADTAGAAPPVSYAM